jgi:hypothetical protein
LPLRPCYKNKEMPPTPRERLDARIRNKEALALRRKASAELAEPGPPTNPVLRAAYDKGRADAFAEAAAVRRREENVAAAARDYAKQTHPSRDGRKHERQAFLAPRDVP